MSTRPEATLAFLTALARNPLFGGVLAIVGLTILAVSGRDAWGNAGDALETADIRWLAASCVAFAAAHLMLAFSITYALRGAREVFFGSMASQTLKYVPGSIWQTSYIFAEATVKGVGIYVAATLFAAAAALSIADASAIRFVGIAGVGALLIAAVVRLGFQRAIRACSLAAGAAAFVVLSGMAIARSLGAGSSLGLDLATGWGMGVLAVPVPAGLGVREGVLSVVSDSEPGVTVAASALHRIATTLADGIIGGLGILWWRRSRSRAIGRSGR